MFKKVVFLFFILLSSLVVFSQNTSPKQIITPHVHPGLTFTQNNGQWNNNILGKG